MKTVFWDIEAGGLKSPFDQVLTSAFKPYGEKPYAICRAPSDTNDKKLCMQIRDELEKYDIIVGYYTLGYDKPFLNGRLLKQGERTLKRKLHIDCHRIAKQLFKWTLHSRRLITICELLGIEGKTRVEPTFWEQMKYDALEGKKQALEQIRKHNIYDVITLEAAYDKCFKHEVNSVSLA